MKALVWFWLIDETLGANPFTLSFMRSGSTFQVVEQMDEDHDGGDSQGDDQVLVLGKDEREK